MRLRTTAGAYAGEIRDYTFSAAQAALRTGTAERIEDASVTAPAPVRPSGTDARRPPAQMRPRKRGRE